MADRYSGLASGYSEIQSVSRSFLNTEKYRAEIQGSLRGFSQSSFTPAYVYVYVYVYVSVDKNHHT